MTAPRTVAEVLDAAADLLTPEGAWTQGAYKRDARDRPIGVRNYSDGVGPACKWCGEGALHKIAGSFGSSEAEEFFRTRMGYRLAAFNDAPGRTQAEVVAKLREAAALAREKGK